MANPEEEDEERLLIETDTFLSSQVSFDIEAPEQPRRKMRKKKDEGDDDENLDTAVTECPGCGGSLPESEFVDAILSFVTGAADYLAGDPVRVRSVQMLQQIISEGRLPDPHSEWSMEVVQRLEQHIEHMADERARVSVRQDSGGLETVSKLKIEEKIRAEVSENMRAEIEEEIVGEVALAIREQVRQQTLDEMVPQLRAEIEQEMWEQFEDILRAERAKNKD